MHMNRQHNWTSADVLHDCVVVSVEPGEVLLITEQDVGLEAVFVVRVDASADAGVLADPVARVNIDYCPHQV